MFVHVEISLSIPLPGEGFGSSVFARQMGGRKNDMAKRVPLTDKDGEVRELTTHDFKHFKSAEEILPKELVSVIHCRVFNNVRQKVMPLPSGGVKESLIALRI
jgi:hypothetical protein